MGKPDRPLKTQAGFAQIICNYPKTSAEAKAEFPGLRILDAANKPPSAHGDMNSNEAVPGGYEKLTVYQLGRSLALRAHALSLALPALEMFEEGSQLRRASKRVSACIVEGYAQRRYKREYIRYLYRSLGSSDESKEHLKYLLETGSAKDTVETTDLINSYGSLSRQISSFIYSVERQHVPPRPGSAFE